MNIFLLKICPRSMYMKMGMNMDQAWAGTLDSGHGHWTLDLKMDQKYGGGVTFTEVDFCNTAEVGIFSKVAFLSSEFSLQNSAVFRAILEKIRPGISEEMPILQRN